MARSSPTVLLVHVNEDTYSSYDITEEYAYFIVLYKGQAFNLRHWANHYTKGFIDSKGPKYVRTCFANSAHCIRLAQKLNRENDTDEFTVVQVRGDSVRTIK
jgi:hypothetical protein